MKCSLLFVLTFCFSKVQVEIDNKERARDLHPRCDCAKTSGYHVLHVLQRKCSRRAGALEHLYLLYDPWEITKS